MATLDKWLETKDYGIGLALLTKYSKNRVMLQNLSRKQNRGKLEYELRKIAKDQGIVIGNAVSKDFSTAHDSAPEIPGVNTHSLHDQLIDLMNAQQETMAEGVATGKLKIIRNAREINYEELPKELQLCWDENRDSYKEMRATHEKLKLMENATAEDREPLVRRIAELDDKVRSNWDVIDSWDPEKKPEAGKIVDIDHKRINANRKFISTNLKSLLEINDEKKAATVKLKVQDRYNELKASGEELDPETIDRLTKAGIQC